WRRRRVFAMDGLAAVTEGASRFIGTARAKGKPKRESATLSVAGLARLARASARNSRSHDVRRRGGRSSKRGSAQQVGLPQRALLTFSLSVFKPTAPTRPSSPTPYLGAPFIPT